MRAANAFVGVALSVLLVSSMASAAESSVPRIAAKTLNYKLGIVDRGKNIEQRIALANEGSGNLEISGVSTSCECAKARFDSRIAPGRDGEVTVAVDTQDLLGPVTIDVVIESNDPVLPRLKLELELKVQPKVFAKPGYARLQYVLGEPGGGIKQVFWSDDFDDLQIVRVESPYPFVRAIAREAKPEERKAGGRGRQWVVDIEIGPQAQVGPLTGNVRVWTNHPVDRLTALPLSGFVRPAVALTPPEADLRPFSRLTPPTFSIDVRNFATEPIEVRDMLRASWPDVQVKTVPLVPGRRFRVDVTLPKGLPVGALRGVVVVATNSPNVPELEIPIRALVTD